MGIGTVIILFAIVVAYYWLRDLAAKHAQHKRVIAAKCSCGSCHAKKMEGRDKH